MSCFTCVSFTARIVDWDIVGICMGRAAATALWMGQVGEDGVVEGRMGSLLRGTTAENAPLSWLLLRCLLDDQVHSLLYGMQGCSTSSSQCYHFPQLSTSAV